MVTNSLNIVGKLVRLDVREALSKGGKPYVSCNLTLRIGEEEGSDELQVRMFSMKYKNKPMKLSIVTPKGINFEGDVEYIVVEGKLEKVGSWEVDLSAYAKTADVNSALANKVDIDSKWSKLKVEEKDGAYYCPVKEANLDSPNAVCNMCIAEQLEH